MRKTNILRFSGMQQDLDPYSKTSVAPSLTCTSNDEEFPRENDIPSRVVSSIPYGMATSSPMSFHGLSASLLVRSSSGAEPSESVKKKKSKNLRHHDSHSGMIESH